MTFPKADAPTAGMMPLVSVRDQRANFSITDPALSRLVAREFGEFTRTPGISIEVNERAERATALLHTGDRVVEQVARWLRLDQVSPDAVAAALYAFMVRLCKPDFRQYWRDLRLRWRGFDFTYYHDRDFFAFSTRTDDPIRLAHDRTHACVYEVLPAFLPATVDFAHLAWSDQTFFAAPLAALSEIPLGVRQLSIHVPGTPESPGYHTPDRSGREGEE